jgi:hypothetical protein
VPRPSIPTKKYPFRGLLRTADRQKVIGDVRGQFFRGLEKGDPVWRGQLKWSGPPERILRVGDTATLFREGYDPLEIVVMNAAADTIAFRCGPSLSLSGELEALGDGT